MLIVTRRIGEKIIIGDREIEATILGVKGNQVKLGFDADKDISIHREELFNRILLDNDPINKLKINEFLPSKPIIKTKKSPLNFDQKKQKVVA